MLSVLDIYLYIYANDDSAGKRIIIEGFTLIEKLKVRDDILAVAPLPDGNI